MNYEKIYESIINIAKNRDTNQLEYYEKHHIIPRCMNGSDDPDNLVKLTAREHFIAHQLLVKIYPNNHSLIRAANMMCTFNDFQSPRSKNRLYAWLRRQMSIMMKTKTGVNNNSFGTVWVYNISLKENKKIDKEEISYYIDEGWELGRKIKWNNKLCKCCNSPLIDKSLKTNYCSKECRKSIRIGAFDGREAELVDNYRKFGSLNKAIKEMGLPGAMGTWYNQAKEILDKAA